MDVIALVGPSGTGKSHRALIVARQHNADAIIDDGILIKDNHLVAGYSAKREKSKIMAIKRAIFIIDGHADEVKNAIEKEKPERILILGTSDNMVHQIKKALDLPEISYIVRIQDIATKAEMAKAKFYRQREGKHIIPVPTIELKPHFSGYLIDPIHTILRKKTAHKSQKYTEKSIVRPIFSYYGRLIIDDSSLVDIIKIIAKTEENFKVDKIHISHIFEKGEDRGINIYLDIYLHYGANIPQLVESIQDIVKEKIENMTGMFIHEINVNVKKLIVKKN